MDFHVYSKRIGRERWGELRRYPPMMMAKYLLELLRYANAIDYNVSDKLSAVFRLNFGLLIDPVAACAICLLSTLISYLG